MVTNLYSNFLILVAIVASVVGGGVAMGGAPTVGVPLPAPRIIIMNEVFQLDGAHYT